MNNNNINSINSNNTTTNNNVIGNITNYITGRPYQISTTSEEVVAGTGAGSAGGSCVSTSS